MPAAPPHPRRRAILWRTVAIAIATWIGLIAATGPVSASVGRPLPGGALAVVDDDEPAETTSTNPDLLVSGDGSAGAESTTTTSTTVAEATTEQGSLDEQAQIWLIVGGLVTVALLIGIWTWRYWIRTKPVPPVPPEPQPDPTTVFHRG